MFTDLKGSTALYERIGDARAYHLVREHFAFLAEIVREQDGAIVKTVGDAVMAAFADPAAAVRAALAVQERVAGFNRSHDAAAPGEAIVIKLRSEEHTSELQSLMRISYAVFCLKKKIIDDDRQ